MNICIAQLLEMIAKPRHVMQSNSSRGRPVRFALSLVFFIAGLMLVSCQPFRSATAPNLLPEADDVIELSGRIAYRTSVQSGSVLFKWRSEKSAYELQLSGRLGIGRMTIRGTKESADIVTPRGELLENVDLQRWLVDALQIDVPILELPACFRLDCDFVKKSTKRQYDTFGRLEQFESQGWSVNATYARNQSDELDVKELQLQSDDSQLRLFFNL